MKPLGRLLYAGLFACLASTAVADSADQVNFLNWAMWIDPNVVTQFQQNTGTQVNQTFFSDEDMLKARLLQKNNGLDLVVPTLRDMQIEMQAGLFQPLDKSQIPNYKNLSPSLLKKTASVDPGNKYGIIYDWGTIGIGYNVDAVRKALGPNVNINDWQFALNPKYLAKLQSCGVSFYDTPLIIYGVTLHYLGLNPNSTNLADFQTATDYLLKIRPYLTYFSNSNYIFDLASGNLCLVIGYSGDIIRAQQYANAGHNHIHIQYVIPKSGAPIEIDMMAIPADAPHPAATYKLINTLLEPKNAAATSNIIFAPNEVPASKPYLNAIFQQPDVYPSDQFIDQKLFTILTPPPAVMQQVTNMWLEVRYGIKEEN